MTLQHASTDCGDVPRSNTCWKADGTACMRESSEERRRVRRHAQYLPLTVSVFNRGAHFEAQMVNCSQDGVCAETYHRILPGTSLHIRIDLSQAAALEKAAFPELRSTALGEVKWCRTLGEEPSPRYLVGIRYYSYY